MNGALPMRQTSPMPPPPGQDWLRTRAIAAEVRIRAAERKAQRKANRNRALVWLSIVGNFVWPYLLFRLLVQ